jgi:hypothetical protein
VLGFGLRVLPLLGRQAMSLLPTLLVVIVTDFALVIFFLDRVWQFLLGLASNPDSPTYTFCIAGTTGIYHDTWFKKFWFKNLFYSEIMNEHLYYIRFDHWNLSLGQGIIVTSFVFLLYVLSKHHM